VPVLQVLVLMSLLSAVEIRLCPMNCAITVALSSLNAGLERDVCRIDELWQEGWRDLGAGF
jgi:hypothetical protein|tara:strand:+ start:512 stop:694 length:183 start_codon:yes stop_codon:yes gene_type:complete